MLIIDLTLNIRICNNFFVWALILRQRIVFIFIFTTPTNINLNLTISFSYLTKGSTMNYVKLSICSMFFLFLFIPETYAQKPQVKNVHFVDKDKTIVVYYDLVGNYKKKYTISLSLSDDFGKTFKIKPISVAGELGKNIKTGRNKKIYWSVKNDFPKGLSGDGFVFAVDAQLKKGKTKWPFYVFPAIGAIGAVAYYSLQEKEASTGSIDISVPTDF